MKVNIKTEVTIVMSGHEADELATWMYENNACGDNADPKSTSFQSAIAGQLLRRLRDLPETGEIGT
jgi:hypothetical protein